MKNTKKITNTYDDTKKMLNTIRNIQENTKPKPNVIREQYGNEQVEYNPKQPPQTYQGGAKLDSPPQDQGLGAQGRTQESEDYAVINDVEVVIHSEDREDLELNDEEKSKISQLIDDFRDEVMETAQFDKLQIYETSAKLDGKIGEFGLGFTLSTGDDTGLYINGQMLKIDENSLSVINKLNTFHLKFSSTINDLLVRRRTT